MLQHPDRMPGAKWFADTQLNFAENLLARRDDHVALVFCNERGARRELTYAQLHSEVGRVAAGLRELGISPGDRVAGFVPNLPETVIAMLATTSLGAVWTSCSPDFGINGVLDRFGQIAPRVIFTADGYFYSGKTIDSLEPIRGVLERLPSVERVVVIPYVERRPGLVAPAERGQFRATSARRVPRRIHACRVRRAAVRDVFVGHHGRPEVHRARSRRHAAAASQGTPAAHRPEARRPAVLLHDLRLDDVELAGVRPGLRLHAGAVRGLAVRAGSRRAVADGRARARDALRHEPEIPGGAREGRRRAGRVVRPVGAALDPLDRLAAGARAVRLRLLEDRARTFSSPPFRAAPTSFPASASATRGCRSIAGRSSAGASA